MRLIGSLLLIVLTSVFSCPIITAIGIDGGRIEDVVVAVSGSSDSTFTTEFINNWFARGPNAFDIDKDGNVYILDWLGEKVVKFDKEGKWVSTFTVPSAPGAPGTRSVGRIPDFPESERPIAEIAVDNNGNVYVTTGNTLKFSPDGTLLFRLHNAVLPHVAVDAKGKFFNFGDKLAGIVWMFSGDGELKATLHHDFEYQDRIITQKEAGNDIYFTVNKYLVKTTLEDYLKSGKLDTVAVLPNKLRLRKYEDEGVEHQLPILPPPYFIGVDRNNCFYFHDPSYWYDEKWDWICQSHLIDRWCLENGELHPTGFMEMHFLKGKDGECFDRGLWDFAKRKQFIISGDGTIYFLHGTVDTIKVSKIIME